MANQNIPSFMVEYKDGQLAIPVIQNLARTDTVLVIGMAVDGPTGVPTKLSASNAEKLFGPLTYGGYYTVPAGSTALTGDYNGNTLVKGVAEVTAGGGNDIIMLRVGGVAATGGPGTVAMSAANFYIQALYPGSMYNNLTCTIASSSLSIPQATIGKGTTISYALTGKTVAQLMQEINTDPKNTTIQIKAYTSAAYTNTCSGYANGSVALTNGTNGTLDNGTSGMSGYRSLLTASTTGAFATMNDIDADIIFISGIYMDDNYAGTNTASIATDLASACFLSTCNGYPKIGVIGLRPLLTIDATTVANKVAQCISSSSAAVDATRGTLSPGYFMYAAIDSGSQFSATDPNTGLLVDTGRYVQVVAGPDVVISNAQVGSYIDSPAGLYAGLISTLEPHRPTTNKKLQGVNAMAFEFTNDQVNQLAGGQAYDATNNINGHGGAYVVLRRHRSGSVIVNSDNTAAIRRSDYNKLNTLRIVNYIIEQVRGVGEPFIGEPRTYSTIAAMNTAVKAVMDSIAESGAIAGKEGMGYTFQIVSSPLDAVLGRINIEMSIRPSMQIQKINITVNLVPPTG